MAKHVRSGMSVYVLNETNELISEIVSNVSDVVKQGYMAPLTDEGTLIVDGVAASCYATINSHRVAHSALAPMRWWYRWAGAEKATSITTGIHWFPKMLYEITAVLLPSIIQA
jgi:hypothetical protein